MPKLGMEMTEATLVRWLVHDGERVSKGQPFYEIETEKVESEIASPVEGVVSLVAEPGDVYEVGDLLARVDP